MSEKVFNTLGESLSSLEEENKEYVKYRAHLESAISSVLLANEKLLKSYAERCALLEKTKESVRLADIKIKEGTAKINDLKMKNAFLNNFVTKNSPNSTITQMKQISQKYREEVNQISNQSQLILDNSPESKEIQNILIEKNAQNRELMERNKELRKLRDEAFMELVKFDNDHEKQLRPLIQILAQKIKESNRLEKSIEFTNENILRKSDNNDLKQHFTAETESAPYFELLDLLNDDDFEDKSLSAVAFGVSFDQTDKSLDFNKTNESIKNEESNNEGVKTAQKDDDNKENHAEKVYKEDVIEEEEEEEREVIIKDKKNAIIEEEEESKTENKKNVIIEEEEEEEEKNERIENKEKEVVDEIIEHKQSKKKRRPLRKEVEVETDAGTEAANASRERNEIEIMTDESILKQVKDAIDKQKKLDLLVQNRTITEISRLQNTSFDLDNEISTIKEANKKREEDHLATLSRLKMQSSLDSIVVEPSPVKPKETVDAEVMTTEMKDLETLKAEIEKKTEKASETFLKEQKTLDLKDTASKLELELNVIRLANERKTADLHSYLERLKAVNSAEFSTKPETKKEKKQYNEDEEKIKRRKERLKGVDRILKQREKDLQVLERKVVDLQTINESINKEIKEKAKQPKMDIKAMCNNLKICRKQMKEYSRQAEFLRIENDALQEEILTLNMKYNESAEADLKDKTEKSAAALAKMKQKFYSIKGVSNSSVPLCCEEELTWIQYKTKEISEAIGVIQMRAGTVATKIDKQQKMCKELKIPIPEAPPQYETILNSRFQ